MDYKELFVEASEEYSEILIGELGELGFEAFVEDESQIGFKGYIKSDLASVPLIEECLDKYSAETAIKYSWLTVPAQNWNNVWESNFEPVYIANKVYIRADFHEPKPEFPFQILINPKMSFGTGHHSTTELVITELLKLDSENRINGKSLLDAGCGTGILAIMAAMLSAGPIMAYDIDPWPVDNSRENFELNGFPSINLWQGTANGIDAATQLWDGPHKFEIILANINRNILLEEMGYYAASIAANGYLIMSGFYTEDIEVIVNAGKQYKLDFVRSSSLNNWASITLQASH